MPTQSRPDERPEAPLSPWLYVAVMALVAGMALYQIIFMLPAPAPAPVRGPVVQLTTTAAIGGIPNKENP